MKRSPLIRKTPLKAKRYTLKRTRINPISKKKMQQIKDELPIREQLCFRAGGIWLQTSKHGGHCKGGICEQCNQPPDQRGLHPHELIFRSHQGLLSLENSRMLCGRCHSAYHRIRER